MADNIIIPPTGSGTATPSVSTDDIGGFHHQRVKLGLGADGTAVTVSSGDGVTGTGTIRVTQANDVTVGITATALPLPTGASTSALQLPDGHNVTVDNASVAITAAALPLPAGASTAALQLADGHNVTVDNASLVVDGSAVTQPVSAVTLPLPAGAATSALQLAAGHDVTIDNAGAGAAVNIQDGGNVISIDGTVDIEVAGVAPSLNTGVRDAGTQRVTVATNDLVPISVATLPLPSGASTSALQLPDGHAVTVDNASIAITAAALPLPSGAATSALQLADGHNVTIDNAAAGAAVNIQDGGNTITVDAAALPLPAGASTSALQLPDGHAVTVDNASLPTTNAIVDGWDNAASDGSSVSGDTAHDTADSGEPVKVGNKAVALGADPTEVAANDRTDWYSSVAGIPFVLGGHMNTKTQEWRADGAFTDDDIAEAVDASHKLVVTSIAVMVDAAATTNPDVRVGFGATSVPTEPASGASVAGIVTSHSGIAAGSGVVIGDGSGIVGIGALGEELRATVTTPTGGSIRIVTKYFLIAA